MIWRGNLPRIGAGMKAGNSDVSDVCSWSVW